MENTAFLQAGLLTATIFLFAYCLTLHDVGKFRSGTAYALTFSTFLSFVCVKWIQFAFFNALAVTFFLLAISGATVAYANFYSPTTDRVKTTAKLAYGIGAFLLFVIAIWTFDNYHAQRAEKVIEHVSGKVDTLAAKATINTEKIGKIDTAVAKLAKSDTTIQKSVADTKSELWDKIDDNGQKTGDKLDRLSLKQERMNLNQQKKR